MRQGWETRTLNDICECYNGLWTGKKPPFQKVGVIRNTNFTKDGKLDDREIVYLDVEQSQFSKRKLQFGDIILEKSGGGPKQPVGRVIIFDKLDGDFSFSNFTSVLRVVDKKVIDFTYLHRFLFHCYISGDTEKMQSHSTGIRNLKFEEYKSTKIPLPPLAVQKEIVSILDEAFAVIDKAKENAEKNLQNAKEIFDSISHTIFSNPDEAWKTLDLSTLLEKGWIISHLDGNHGSFYPKKEEFVKTGVPYISANCFDNDNIDMSLAKYLTPERASVFTKGVAKNQDVLFAHNATVGPVALLKTNEQKVILSTSLTYYRCNPDFILPAYLVHFMKSRYFVDQYSQIMRQSTRNQIPITKQREFYHIIPPIEKQKTIVNKLDNLLPKIKEIEAIYQQKLFDLEELKKSILQKAFAGELTLKQIPELI